MLATLGFIFADFVKLPGDVHAVSSLDAHNAAVSSGALIQVLLWTGLLELITIPALTALPTSGRAPGDYSFDPLKLGAKPANLEKYKISELKNGRLAMLAFSGIVTQAALTGKGFPCKYLLHPSSTSLKLLKATLDGCLRTIAPFQHQLLITRNPNNKRPMNSCSSTLELHNLHLYIFNL
eukprot:gene31494-41990_t